MQKSCALQNGGMTLSPLANFLLGDPNFLLGSIFNCTLAKQCINFFYLHCTFSATAHQPTLVFIGCFQIKHIRTCQPASSHFRCTCLDFLVLTQIEGLPTEICVCGRLCFLDYIDKTPKLSASGYYEYSYIIITKSNIKS